jgi:putative transposase
MEGGFFKEPPSSWAWTRWGYMTQEALECGETYHIYNRGNNRETLFLEERNYAYFLQLYRKYIGPIADIFAYCLLGNHFHFLVRIKDLDFQELRSSKERSSYLGQRVATFFGTYTKAINKAYDRSGSLFEKNFKRKPVASDKYFYSLLTYIHFNPKKHGFVDDFRDWPYSSYPALCDTEDTFLDRIEVLSRFDGLDGFLLFHEDMANFNLSFG